MAASANARSQCAHLKDGAQMWTALCATHYSSPPGLRPATEISGDGSAEVKLLANVTGRRIPCLYSRPERKRGRDGHASAGKRRASAAQRERGRIAQAWLIVCARMRLAAVGSARSCTALPRACTLLRKVTGTKERLRTRGQRVLPLLPDIRASYNAPYGTEIWTRLVSLALISRRAACGA